MVSAQGNSKISIIAAVSENRAIGRGNQLLWRIPEDMRRFRELTTGHVVIMGRKTFESIGKPLPNRTNIIITRDKSYSASGCIVAHSLEEALEKAKTLRPLNGFRVAPSKVEGRQAQGDKDEVFVMGGGEIYRQAIGLAGKLYLTLVHKNFEGDAFFPEYPEFKKEVYREEGESANGLKFTFLELEK